MSEDLGAAAIGLELHLEKAGELLRADALADAENEVNAALEIEPNDLRAWNLRGLVHFRAGRYEDALAVYSQLAMTQPEDASIRLNLGLVELRMGRSQQAATDLKKVVDVEPENLRAQGYLGLALMRMGDLSGARAAFDRAGQVDLVRQVDERLVHASDEGLAQRSALRFSASAGVRSLSHAQPFTPVELEPPSEELRRQGAWQVRQAGERVPLPGPEGDLDAHTEALAMTPALSVASFATARMLRTAELGESYAVVGAGETEGKLLALTVDGRLPLRTIGIVASTGQLTFEPLMRRMRGQKTTETFGEGVEEMRVAIGSGVVLASAMGKRFTALRLDDDIVYVRERVIFSFEETLHWENGRVPGAREEDNRIVQFRGTGRLVIATDALPMTMKVAEDKPLFVAQTALIGWIGRVVPRVLAGPDGPTPYVECAGEGALLLLPLGA